LGATEGSPPQTEEHPEELDEAKSPDFVGSKGPVFVNVTDSEFVPAVRDMFVEQLESCGIPTNAALDLFRMAFDLGRGQVMQEISIAIREYGVMEGVLNVAIGIEAEALIDGIG
jgi:hypothetical protein